LVFQDIICYWNENASEDIDTSDNCCRQVLLSRHIGVRGRIRRPAPILRLQFALYLRFYYSSTIVQYLILNDLALEKPEALINEEAEKLVELLRS